MYTFRIIHTFENMYNLIIQITHVYIEVKEI